VEAEVHAQPNTWLGSLLGGGNNMIGLDLGNSATSTAAVEKPENAAPSVKGISLTNELMADTALKAAFATSAPISQQLQLADLTAVTYQTYIEEYAHIFAHGTAQHIVADIAGINDGLFTLIVPHLQSAIMNSHVMRLFWTHRPAGNLIRKLANLQDAS
jgi:hypothetical protein